MTWAYVGGLVVVVVVLLLLGGQGEAPPPEPPLRWDEIPVCLDCGTREV